MVETMLKFYCADPNIDQLYKAHEDDAGYDIRCAEHTVVIPARESRLIHTKLHVAIPKNFVGIVKPRSGLAVKSGIDVGAGVIDAGYRELVGVLLFNHSDRDFVAEYGDRIAQLVLLPIYHQALYKQVDSLEELESTDRAADGFGSSGK